MLRRRLGWLICAVVLLAGGGNTRAAESDASPVLSRIQKSGQLRVGMTGAQPPFNVKSKDGEIIGMDVDLASLMASAMGVELEIVEVPFPQLLPALASGKVDLVMSGLTVTLERNVRFAFVGPYYVSGKSILTKSRTLARIEQASDLDAAKPKLVALEASTSQQFVERVIPKAELATTPSYEEAVQMVLDDKADALVADMPICVLSTLRHADAGLVTLAKPLSIEPIGVALPPGDSLLVNLVENYLNALKATGILDAITTKWFKEAAWLIQVP